MNRDIATMFDHAVRESDLFIIGESVICYTIIALDDVGLYHFYLFGSVIPYILQNLSSHDQTFS